MASAVVSSEPEPDMLARRRAAAHIVVDRGIFIIIFNQYVLLVISRVSKQRSETEYLRGLDVVRFAPEIRTVRAKIQTSVLDESRVII